ncbi:MAG: hypothetical protein DDT37_01734 [Firmicutes bacterium]|nr:hypothetical protein [candidate division NPL-UPA2 bacterium]
MIVVVIVDSTIAAGRVVAPGDTLELSEQEANLLIAMGKARLVDMVAEGISVEEILTDPLAIRETTERKTPEKRHR